MKEVIIKKVSVIIETTEEERKFSQEGTFTFKGACMTIVSWEKHIRGQIQDKEVLSVSFKFDK